MSNSIYVGYPTNGCGIGNEEDCETRVRFITFEEEEGSGTVSWSDSIDRCRPFIACSENYPGGFRIQTVFDKYEVAVFDRHNAIYRATKDDVDFTEQMLFT